MAFKRVLSALMVVLVLVSTLCAFKPIEANFEPLSADEYPIGLLSVWSNGVLQNEQCRIDLYGDGYIEGITGYKVLDNFTLSFDTDVERPEIDTYNGYYYYLIQVKTYGGCNMFVYGERETTNVNGIHNTVEYLDVREFGLVDVVLELDFERDTTLPLKTYFFRVIFSQANVISDYEQGYTAGYMAGLLYGQENGYNMGYQDGLESGDAYHKGRADGIASGLFGLFTNPIGEIFKFTIVPAGENPAVTLGAVFLVLVAISLIIIYLKYFAGG